MTTPKHSGFGQLFMLVPITGATYALVTAHEPHHLSMPWLVWSLRALLVVCIVLFIAWGRDVPNPEDL